MIRLRILLIILACLSPTRAQNAPCTGCGMLGQVQVKQPGKDAKNRVRLREAGLWGSGIPYVPDIPVAGGTRFVARVTDAVVVPYNGSCEERFIVNSLSCTPRSRCGIYYYLSVELKEGAANWANVWDVRVKATNWNPYMYVGINYGVCHRNLPPADGGVPGTPPLSAPSELVYDEEDPEGPSIFEGFQDGYCGISYMLSPNNKTENSFVITIGDSSFLGTSFNILEVVWSCAPCAW